MTRALCPLRVPAATLFAALAFGCAGGQTGEESGEPACDESRTALAADEDSPLGFGAGEVLAAASARSAALEWLETNPSYGPESGASELTLSLDALGTAWFVSSRKRDGSEGFPCWDRVDVDVAVMLATSGGALAESFESELRATESTTAELTRTFEDGDVDGTLSFDSAALGGRTVERITFDASFSGGALSGSLSAGIEQVSGETASLQELTIACFGEATDRCPQR
jgi:hypothetical protein